MLCRWYTPERAGDGRGGEGVGTIEGNVTSRQPLAGGLAVVTMVTHTVGIGHIISAALARHQMTFKASLLSFSITPCILTFFCSVPP